MLAWNMMSGELVWQSLNDVSEYLEVQDIEMFIDALLVLQEHTQQQTQNG